MQGLYSEAEEPGDMEVAGLFIFTQKCPTLVYSFVVKFHTGPSVAPLASRVITFQ